LTNLIRKAKQNFYTAEIENSKSKIKWSALNRLIIQTPKKTNSVNSIMTDNGCLEVKKLIANCFADTFNYTCKGKDVRESQRGKQLELRFYGFALWRTVNGRISLGEQ
jgi:hypothetical protein